MATDSSGDLGAFYRFLGKQIESGQGDLTPEDVLFLWRSGGETSAVTPEDIEAVQEGLDDIKAGRYRPADEVLQELRGELDLPESS